MQTLKVIVNSHPKKPVIEPTHEFVFFAQALKYNNKAAVHLTV